MISLAIDICAASITLAKKMLQGSNREEQGQFIALRTHYLAICQQASTQSMYFAPARHRHQRQHHAGITQHLSPVPPSIAPAGPGYTTPHTTPPASRPAAHATTTPVPCQYLSSTSSANASLVPAWVYHASTQSIYFATRQDPAPGPSVRTQHHTRHASTARPVLHARTT